ncbi:alpha-amylase family glycosyl hydrolase [Erythrobacter crassostreae]|uniref:Alpha amylase C-terminal domain-containing protein n=1 Tax=Erythrobacter crassostreae TaxID=2828328 RepID=A0A9X1F569_9SPHN|nr:alpha-amylase family glycosyl hydrolase [Erythrobacter crassostrea]MBV7260357.1 alpha amylase C-terminal domain-containing protein [Erythrobacter crassostrea]
MRALSSAIVLAAGLALSGCDAAPSPTSYEPQSYVEFENAEWTRDAVIYQINTRQFTSEGTFAAAQEQLPRLAEMGIDVVWLMPIHPIGEENRKGSMGSPYSVLDYRAINPDLGTEEEFRAFVDAAHALDIKVILDWVANHSAWDSPLVSAHPEWYTKTPEGDIMPPEGTDWSDVVDFDYSNADLREYMTGSLTYWVREFDVDGYRADVAGYVPTDFWETARGELDAIKPVFMLAEWETRDLHRKAFDATYAWGWKEAMQELVADGSGAGAMRGYYSGQSVSWPRAAYRMAYTDNHDQNSWDGVASEIYGPAYESAIALSFVGPGMPLIYNGQEADLDKQLAFFEKDEIEWKTGQYDGLFRQFVALKTEEQALWNGRYGAPMVDVPNSASDDVLSFIRGDAGGRVFAIFNLSPRAQEVSFDLARHHGAYQNALSGEAAQFAGDETVELAPWGYRVFREKD